MNSKSIKIGIFSVASLSFASQAIMPSYSLISETFSDASPSTIQMITALPGLTGLISSLLVGKVAERISKKNIVIFGISLISIGGLFPILFHDSIYTLLFFAAILGFGLGCLTPIVPSIVSSNFPSDDERQKVLGQNTSFSYIGAIVLIYLGGVLAKNGWVHNYYVYFISLLILVAAILFIPKDKNENKRVKEMEKTESHTSMKLSKHVYYLGLVSMLFMILNNIFGNNLSFYVASVSIGDTSLAGLGSSLNLVGGLVCGFLVSKIIVVIRNNSLAASYLLTAISFIAIYFAYSSIVLFYVGCFLSGFAGALFISQAPFLITLVTENQLIPQAMSVFICIMSLGSFLSPTIVNSIVGLFPGNMYMNVYLFGAVGLVIAAGILFITKFQKNYVRE